VEPDRAGAVRGRSGHCPGRSQRSDRGREGVDGDGEVRHESFQSGATGDRGGLDIQAEVQQKRNPLRGYRPSLEGTAPNGEQVLVELSAVQALVAAQATPEETAAFGQWLVASAQAAANAAKEGGFVGFGAAQVSKGESEMLDQVRAAVSQA